MAQWKKLGLIIKPRSDLYWCRTHCMIPTPHRISEDLVSVYFSGRDDKNRSHIGKATIDLSNKFNIVEYSSEPILKPGKLGCFDDNGVTPSCIVENDGLLFMYYIGWNPGSTVRMHLFGGLAISANGGKTFERWSEAPIIERTAKDPYLNTAPWVIRSDDHWTMYYVSGCGWVNKDLPRYNIKSATSIDGKNWKREGKVCIDFESKSENALARPYVINENNVYKMWFSYKGEAYKIGYAESLDGINWIRSNDCQETLSPSKDKDKFDSKMVEYAAVLRHKGRLIMLYNGDNYGHGGIGVAIQE